MDSFTSVNTRDGIVAVTKLSFQTIRFVRNVSFARVCFGFEGWFSIQVEDDGADGKVLRGTSKRLEFVSEPNYKFRLSRFREALHEHLKANPDFIQPSHLHEVVLQDLDTKNAKPIQDLSVSRLKKNSPWALPVPHDDEHSIYVWLDALTNYLTVCGYPDLSEEWPAECHVIGKD